MHAVILDNTPLKDDPLYIKYAKMFASLKEKDEALFEQTVLDSLGAALEPTSTDAWIKLMASDPLLGVPTLVEKLQAQVAQGRGVAGIFHHQPILAGTDLAIKPLAPQFLPGLTLHEDLLFSRVLEGWTPAEALQTATLNPARAFRAADSLGTVEVGKVADLVLLDADPLIDIWNTTKIRAVVANGRYYDRTALDGLLVAAERAAAARRGTCPSTVTRFDRGSGTPNLVSPDSIGKRR
jgi:hypothetical protein